MFQASHDDAVDGLPENTPVDALPSETLELIELAQAGDREAFTRLFQRYNQQICTYLGRLVGNSELGCDLAQETFLHAWKSLPTLRSDLAFKSWLSTDVCALRTSDGKQLWRWHTSAVEAITIPQVANGRIYFSVGVSAGNAADGLYALNARNGAVLWHVFQGQLLVGPAVG